MVEGFCSHLPYGFVVTASKEIAKIQRQTFFLGLAIFFGKLLANFWQPAGLVGTSQRRCQASAVPWSI